MDTTSPGPLEEQFASDQDSGSDAADSLSSHHHPEPTISGIEDSTRKPPKPPKRRRVTRACDECRRKKIKCDGRQPCTHCMVYSYECSYDQPSNRRRNPAPQYVEGLERRVHRAENLLRRLLPNVNLDDPAIDTDVEQGRISAAITSHSSDSVSQRGQHKKQLHSLSRTSSHQLSQPSRSRSGSQTGVIKSEGDDSDSKSDGQIDTMMQAVAQLDMDEIGKWDYHGQSSGQIFLQNMREQLGDLTSPDTARSVQNTLTAPMVKWSEVESRASSETPSTVIDLPPKQKASDMCSAAIDYGEFTKARNDADLIQD